MSQSETQKEEMEMKKKQIIFKSAAKTNSNISSTINIIEYWFPSLHTQKKDSNT